MSLIDAYLDNPKSPWNRLLMWWTYSAWPQVRDYFARFIYAQHNAKVIIDFESRMSSVIWHATGGMMSKPYYDRETMVSEISRHINDTWEDGYKEGRKCLAEDLGVEDPNKELYE